MRSMTVKTQKSIPLRKKIIGTITILNNKKVSTGRKKKQNKIKTEVEVNKNSNTKKIC